MRINQNIAALNAYRNLVITDSRLNKNLERLSSGLRINRASDDAAGLAISEKMRSQVRGLNQAVRNAQDGISLIQTAEGALEEVHNILQRMRELAIQAANGTMEEEDVSNINDEVQQLIEEIDRIASTTEFNKKTLLNGDYGGEEQMLMLQVGANPNQVVEFSIESMAAEALEIGDLAIESAEAAQEAIDTIDAAIQTVSAERSKLGGIQNRLEHTIANLRTAAENLAAAESRIRDVDMAEEMMAFTKNQILIQAGTAMLAQANIKPQSVLHLLA
ncbi:MAG: flagellin [Firmicutes bacterium]|jgi:flagellin|nr:flagellin [Bacillota bacterium]